MAVDKWYAIVNDEIDDIPTRVEQLKSKYWKQAWIFLTCTIIGSAIMGFGKVTGLIAIGCFLAVTSMVGIFALAIMYHTQLCLYRAIKEIRMNKAT